MGVPKIHLEDSLNETSFRLPIDLRRNLIRYLTHVPVTCDMKNEDFIYYQIKAFNNFGFSKDYMLDPNSSFPLFCDLLRKHYDFVTQNNYNS